MIYIESLNTDPRYNLALEQYVFDNMPKSQEYFMLWQNNNTIVVGKNQNTIGEINKEYVEKENVNVVRRLSGGGAVYHDMGNLNFTFITDTKGSNELDFKLFCQPIKESLEEIGVKAELSGRNDITINGRKFSGNAQYMKDGRIMHHGTIMYNSDLEKVGKALNVSKDKIESKGVKSVRSRVTTVVEHMKTPISLDEFKKVLVNHMSTINKIEKYELTQEDINTVKEIQKSRYDTWEWNYGKSPKYSIKKERRIEGCGKIEIFMEVKNEKILEIEFFGDFFGTKSSEEISKILIGQELKKENLLNELKNINIGDYFFRLNLEDFVDLIIS